MKKIIALVISFILVLSLVACATNDNKGDLSSPPASDGASKGSVPDYSDELYIMVSCLWSNEYFNDHVLGMELAAKFLGVKTETVGPAEWDVDGMVRALEESIGRNPAGIAVIAMDPALDPAIQKAIDAGIPVVAVDADAPNSVRLAFVGTGNYAVGVQGGQKVADLIGGSGKVAILTMPNQTNHSERMQGYLDVFEDFPGIEVVQIADTEGDAVLAASAAAAILLVHPDLDALVCTDASGGNGAATAIREAGLEGRVKVVSMDRGAETLQGIKDGIIDATIVQQTAIMGYYAVVLMHNLKIGDFPVSNNNAAAGITGMPTFIDTGTVIVDKSNVDFFVR